MIVHVSRNNTFIEFHIHGIHNEGMAYSNVNVEVHGDCTAQSNWAITIMKNRNK